YWLRPTRFRRPCCPCCVNRKISNKEGRRLSAPFLFALKTWHRKKIKKSLKSLLPPSITILTVMKPLAHTGI
ncbi:hypothetical protein, partial [Kosakonia radicincitans]|uniref:hypothetical protein n=1 Tax=Kosakonia radicincitans TaxID=283686 RepID=UPI001ABDADEB